MARASSKMNDSFTVICRRNYIEWINSKFFNKSEVQCCRGIHRISSLSNNILDLYQFQLHRLKKLAMQFLLQTKRFQFLSCPHCKHSKHNWHSNESSAFSTAFFFLSFTQAIRMSYHKNRIIRFETSKDLMFSHDHVHATNSYSWNWTVIGTRMHKRYCKLHAVGTEFKCNLPVSNLNSC